MSRKGPAGQGTAGKRREAPTMQLLRAHRDEILRLATARGVSNIRVFGSVARGDATPDSDIDLLVDFQVQKSGFDLIAFADDLEQLLGRSVDVGTGVHKAIKDRVERQATAL
ncbi:MAG: nucleotidyltransferase family protein [Acidimicrobiales bacterium]